MNQYLLSQTDRDFVLEHTRPFWEEVRGRRLFITGATGFFGCWLLETFAHANDALNLNAELVALTRSPEAFRVKAPHLATHPAILLWQGDVRTFAFPNGDFDYVVHAATEASVTLNQEAPLLMLDTICEGTRRTLDFARTCQAKRFLLTSSGAVYGRQPTDLSHVAETYGGAPDTMGKGAAYGEGKRVAETLCGIYDRAYDVPAVVARCFAFVGPYLPLDGAFAVGNFIRDGLAGGPIRIGGDGSPFRSYLYGADLMVYLWTLLWRGERGGIYNVGSENAISIKELAYTVAECFAPAPIEVIIAREADPSKPAERYVPSVKYAAETLGLVPRIGLRDGIERTIAWHRNGKVTNYA